MKKTPNSAQKNEISELIKKKAKRKSESRNKNQSLWFGISTIGIVGWLVMVPTIGGIILGIWLDGKYREHHSWTLTFLITGLGIGCYMAWSWVSSEAKKNRS